MGSPCTLELAALENSARACHLPRWPLERRSQKISRPIASWPLKGEAAGVDGVEVTRPAGQGLERTSRQGLGLQFHVISASPSIQSDNRPEDSLTRPLLSHSQRTFEPTYPTQPSCRKQQKVVIMECLPSLGHCAKHSAWIVSYRPHDGLESGGFFSPLHR